MSNSSRSASTKSLIRTLVTSCSISGTMISKVPLLYESRDARLSPNSVSRVSNIGQVMSLSNS